MLSSIMPDSEHKPAGEGSFDAAAQAARQEALLRDNEVVAEAPPSGYEGFARLVHYNDLTSAERDHLRDTYYDASIIAELPVTQAEALTLLQAGVAAETDPLRRIELMEERFEGFYYGLRLPVSIAATEQGNLAALPTLAAYDSLFAAYEHDAVPMVALSAKFWRVRLMSELDEMWLTHDGIVPEDASAEVRQAHDQIMTSYTMAERRYTDFFQGHYYDAPDGGLEEPEHEFNVEPPNKRDYQERLRAALSPELGAEAGASLADLVTLPGFAHLFNEVTGTPLEAVPLAKIARWTEVMAVADRAQIDRFRTVYDGLGDEAASALMESYVALEHGAEFGDELLDLVEQGDPVEVMPLIDQVNQIRADIRVWGGLFCDYDPELTARLVQGFDQRNTEVLTTAAELARSGPYTLDTQAKLGAVEVTSTQQVQRGLELIGRGAAGLASLRLRPALPREAYPGVEAQYLEADRSILLTTRQETIAKGEHDLRLERGRWSRANFTVDVSDAGTTVALLPAEREATALSIRLDLEADPDRPGHHRMTLDIGGRTDVPGAPDQQVAELITVGAQLRAQRRGERADYHVVLGPITPERFAQLVEYVRIRFVTDARPLAVPVPPPDQP